MRHLVLALTLTLLASTAAHAADSGEATAKEATEFAKRVALATQAAKDKTGQYPASVKVWTRGKEVEVKVQVTPLADGYSIKAIPAVDARASCPLENANIDVNSGPGGGAIVSLVGSTADGMDIVAFATTGTELAITVTQGDQTVTVNGTTSLADVPAVTPPAATTAATKPAPAPAVPAAPAPATATTAPAPKPAPVAPALAPTEPATATAPAPAPTLAAPKPTPSTGTRTVAKAPRPEPTAPAAPSVPAANTAPDSPSASASVSSTPPANPPELRRRQRDATLRAVEELAQQPIQLSDGATPIQRPSSSIPK